MYGQRRSMLQCTGKLVDVLDLLHLGNRQLKVVQLIVYLLAECRAWWIFVNQVLGMLSILVSQPATLLGSRDIENRNLAPNPCNSGSYNSNINTYRTIDGGRSTYREMACRC